jgi:hypothetical protein
MTDFIKFLHISTTDQILSKDTFIPADIDYKVKPAYELWTLGHALYLSQAYPEGDSDWLRFCKHEDNHTADFHIIQRGKPKKYDTEIKTIQVGTTTVELKSKQEIIIPERRYISWCNSNNYFYGDINFEKHKIYVMNTLEDVRQFFLKYGVYKKCYEKYFDSYMIPYDIQKKREEEHNKMCKARYYAYKNNKTLNNFIKNTRVSFSSQTIEHIKEIRNKRNMPLIKIYKNNIVIPKCGITVTFYVDILRTIEHNIKIIGDETELINGIKTRLDCINYRKIVNDGYNGIYYSRSLFPRNTKQYDDNNSSKENYLDYNDFKFSYFPHFMDDTSDKDLESIKEEIQGLLYFLSSDSLILFNWIFD